LVAAQSLTGITTRRATADLRKVTIRLRGIIESFLNTFQQLMNIKVHQKKTGAGVTTGKTSQVVFELVL
jgi:hypothetical protein